MDPKPKHWIEEFEAGVALAKDAAPRVEAVARAGADVVRGVRAAGGVRRFVASRLPGLFNAFLEATAPSAAPLPPRPRPARGEVIDVEYVSHGPSAPRR